jgi:Domain of unknown function (DUF397)
VTDSVTMGEKVKVIDIAPAAWRKSSYSGGAGNCVEIAGDLPGAVGVRDSKDPAGPALVFTPRTWRAFVATVKNGGFDGQ